MQRDQSERCDNEKRKVGNHIEEIRHAKEDARIREMVVFLRLRDWRQKHQRKRDGACRQQERNPAAPHRPSPARQSGHRPLAMRGSQ
ncbi:hypothetical protein FGKAn22_18150 [Ferrigenium kumadai]|uniref:Uncharacterized protein n=1 Tax=Ferrigenium kumadai TaxID=1682490 RepID=A0AAN1SZU5_9PROT|nr:hypothetical protein FGKAn22_18150 [Ferrigenium kumadai]